MSRVPDYSAWRPVAPDIQFNNVSEARNEALTMSNTAARRLAACRYVIDRVTSFPPRSGFFDAIVLPMLAFYLEPAKCPSITDTPSLWEDQLDFVWSCFLLRRESEKGGDTQRVIAAGALKQWWPGLSKWMLYLFQRAIEDGNLLEGKWRDVLVTALACSSYSVVVGDLQVADATWHRSTDVGLAFVQLSQHIMAYTLDKFSSDPPEESYEELAMIYSELIARQVIYTAACSRLPGATPTLEKSFTSPSLGESVITSLITAISIRPLPLTVLDSLLASANDVACALDNRFLLAKYRATYWNAVALRAIAKLVPGDRLAPRKRRSMIRGIESALTYIYFALGYMSREIIPDLVQLQIFRTLVQLAPLAKHPSTITGFTDLKATIQRFIVRLTVFSGWKSIAQAVGPYIDALRVYELDAKDLKDSSGWSKRSFIEIFSELYEASRSYGDRAQRVCWNPNCPAATLEAYAQQNGPLCQACSRCQAVAYCSSECQREHWKLGHKEECQRVCENGQLYKDEHRPGRGSAAVIQHPPILLTQRTFMYHYIGHILSKNLNLIYTHFVDPTTGAYINMDDTIHVMFLENPAVYFTKGPIQDSFWGYELSEVHRFVQFGVPWNMTTDGCNRRVGPPDMQILFGTVQLPNESEVLEEDSVLKLGPAWSRNAQCPLGGWQIVQTTTGGVQ